jgi:hypothetical protein
VRTIATGASIATAAGAVVVAAHLASPVEQLQISAVNVPNTTGPSIPSPEGSGKPDHARKSLIVVHPTRLTYTVKSGDTLSGIAQRLFGQANLWPRLYDANLSAVGSNPNLITPGEVIRPILGKHAAYGKPVVTKTDAEYQPRHARATNAAGSPPQVSGPYSCSDLEQLWDSVGGNPNAAFMAAEIAMAESGGHPYGPQATDYDSNGTVDEGLWQINSSWGTLATYDPAGNARAAVQISSDGTNWHPWMTYDSGLEYGRC